MMMLRGSFLSTGEFKINSLLDMIVDEKSLQGFIMIRKQEEYVGLVKKVMKNGLNSNLLC